MHQSTDLVIMEVGAGKNSWLDAWPVQPPVLALIQDRRETPTGFAARVSAKLDRLWAQGGRLRRVLLLGEDTLDVPTLGARLAILRKIRARETTENAAVHVSLDLQ